VPCLTHGARGQNPKTRKESIQRLYTTMLLCKHQFQVSYLRYTWAADLFETSVLLEELQLAYSRRSKKLPTDSFSKHLSNRTSSDNCPLKQWLDQCSTRIQITTVHTIMPDRGNLNQ